MLLTDLAVLLVEPSLPQQKIIRQFFSDLGVVRIHTSKTAEDALQEMPILRPDLVISALYLPDMTGTELVYAMRGRDDIGEIAFILISSQTSFRELDPIRQAGSVAILPKPFTASDLCTALNATIDHFANSEVNLGNFEADMLEVLLVDDSRMIRRHIRNTLASMGIEKFTEADNGAEAVEHMRNKFFDLIVTDYNMPEMDGQELTTYIRSESNQSSVPILMVTSEENENRLASVAQSGVSAICDKPFEKNTVRSLLEGFFAEES